LEARGCASPLRARLAKKGKPVFRKMRAKPRNLEVQIRRLVSHQGTPQLGRKRADTGRLGKDRSVAWLVPVDVAAQPRPHPPPLAVVIVIVSPGASSRPLT